MTEQPGLTLPPPRPSEPMEKVDSTSWLSASPFSSVCRGCSRFLRIACTSPRVMPMMRRYLRMPA